LSCGNRRVVTLANTALGVVLLLGTLLCAALVMSHANGGPAGSIPTPDSGDRQFMGILDVIALAPWAYVGFESATHSANELSFHKRRLGLVLGAGVLSGTMVYLATTYMSFAVTPPQYDSLEAYLSNLSTHQGILGLPVFYAVQSAAGDAGLLLLGLTLVAGVMTSLLGLYRAVGRLVSAMASERLLPAQLAALDNNGSPRKAILAVTAISILVPFVGRAAIGWIVDVTSVSASIAYFYVSLCSLLVAREESNRKAAACGAVGAFVSVAFFFFPLVPNLWSVTAFASESYLILAAWAMLGLLVFLIVFRSDDSLRFGQSTIAWIAMLFLVFFASTMWVRQATHETSARVVMQIDQYYSTAYDERGIVLTPEEKTNETQFLQAKSDEITSSLLDSSLVQMGLVAFALWLMFDIFTLMSRRQATLESRRIAAEETSRAKTRFLSNVSHDIRTPMNAIMGYTQLAQNPDLTPEQMRSYIDKIDAAGTYMLSLVNDVLEMGRIESGRLRLAPTATDLRVLCANVRDVFDGQMREKGLDFVVDTSQITDGNVMCDQNHMNSMLFNLIGNAYKFTPQGGSVIVSIAQKGPANDDHASYELRVRDTGIGMSPEFAQRIFEPFEREQTSTVSNTQGTGLGMSIVKGIVDAMGGTIDLTSQPGIGTEFVITFDLELAEARDTEVDAVDHAEPVSLEDKRILLVDDNEINREIASLVLEDLGLLVQTVANGLEAIEEVTDAFSRGDGYDAILMDMRMPVMDGYEATRRIRNLGTTWAGTIPIIAVTANTFDEDIRRADEAGVSGHLAKPLDVDQVAQTLGQLLA